MNFTREDLDYLLNDEYIIIDPVYLALEAPYL